MVGNESGALEKSSGAPRSFICPQSLCDESGSGLSTASQRTAFKYIWGIETGFKRSGSLARRSGGAKMLERGLAWETDTFIDGIAQDVKQYINPNDHV